jgi:hypothetical protein
MNAVRVDPTYLISHGDVLCMEPRIVVIEFMNGEMIVLETMPGTTVDGINDILEDEICSRKGNERLFQWNRMVKSGRMTER